jgi:hypothetical protein
MKTNIQHAAPNAQRPTRRLSLTTIRCSALNVECWVFLLLAGCIVPLGAQSATDSLPALAPPYGELPPSFWQQHQTTIIITSFALLAFALLFLKLLLRPVRPVNLPPDAVARQALAGMQNQPEDGKILSAVSQALRRYVAEKFDLPAGGLTTAEFCVLIAGNKSLDAELAGAISGFLRECDVRKFSPAISAAPLDAATRALELVALAEQRVAERKAVALPPR